MKMMTKSMCIMHESIPREPSTPILNTMKNIIKSNKLVNGLKKIGKKFRPSKQKNNENQITVDLEENFYTVKHALDQETLLDQQTLYESFDFVSDFFGFNQKDSKLKKYLVDNYKYEPSADDSSPPQVTFSAQGLHHTQPMRRLSRREYKAFKKAVQEWKTQIKNDGGQKETYLNNTFKFEDPDHWKDAKDEQNSPYRVVNEPARFIPLLSLLGLDRNRLVILWGYGKSQDGNGQNLPNPNGLNVDDFLKKLEKYTYPRGALLWFWRLVFLGLLGAATYWVSSLDYQPPQVVEAIGTGHKTATITFNEEVVQVEPATLGFDVAEDANVVKGIEWVSEPANDTQAKTLQLHFEKRLPTNPDFALEMTKLSGIEDTAGNAFALDEDETIQISYRDVAEPRAEIRNVYPQSIILHIDEPLHPETLRLLREEPGSIISLRKRIDEQEMQAIEITPIENEDIKSSDGVSQVVTIAPRNLLRDGEYVLGIKQLKDTSGNVLETQLEFPKHSREKIRIQKLSVDRNDPYLRTLQLQLNRSLPGEWLPLDKSKVTLTSKERDEPIDAVEVDSNRFEEGARLTIKTATLLPGVEYTLSMATLRDEENHPEHVPEKVFTIPPEVRPSKAGIEFTQITYGKVKGDNYEVWELTGQEYRIRSVQVRKIDPTNKSPLSDWEDYELVALKQAHVKRFELESDSYNGDLRGKYIFTKQEEEPHALRVRIRTYRKGSITKDIEFYEVSFPDTI